MKTIAREHFTDSFFQLLTETFVGPPANTGSAYLDKGAGLFQTLDGLTAEQASRRAQPGGTTIAAHCEHVRFYIAALHAYMRGATGRTDWSQSWLVAEVTAEDWEGVKAGLRQAYTALVDDLRSTEEWGDDEVGDGLAILVHTAYHLGAIRQLLPRP
jgi:hypothetical protein